MNKTHNLITYLGLGIIIVTLGWTKEAKADHSLAYAMESNSTIAQAVAQIQSVHQVVCDVSNSNQSYYHPDERGRAGTAWKQIALCYQNQADLQAGRQYFQNGGELGFYGASNIVGVLVVSYTWEGTEAKRLIAIEFL